MSKVGDGRVCYYMYLIFYYNYLKMFKILIS